MERCYKTYVEKFDNKDKVTPILYVKDNKKYSKQIEEIIGILKLKENPM